MTVRNEGSTAVIYVIDSEKELGFPGSARFQAGNLVVVVHCRVVFQDISGFPILADKYRVGRNIAQDG